MALLIYRRRPQRLEHRPNNPGPKCRLRPRNRHSPEDLLNILTSEIPSAQAYHLMIQTIIPRPIAWALTVNLNQTFNLAPFSFFNGIAGNPPAVMMSIGYKQNG